MTEFNGYGYCPQCGGRGKIREKRPDGNDICVNGHTYPSAQASLNIPTEEDKKHKFKKGDKVLITADIIGLRYMNGTTGVIESVTAYGHCIIRQTLVREEYLTLVEDD